MSEENRLLFDPDNTSADDIIARYNAGERDFRGANLEEAQLNGANLTEANLREANLR
jgi:uncharacterized protein YjbI with pentapeptide repeats